MKNEGLNKSYQEFISNYFSNIEGVKKLYDRVFKEEDFNGTLQDWYTKFVCDLAWAKNTQYCNTNNSNSGNSGGSPTPTPRKRGTQLSSQDFEGIDFKYKYPGDRNYRYGVKGTDWYAKNINNQKVFNISKDGFTSSVENLNRQFPNAFKEVAQPVSPKTNTPETPTQDSTKVGTNLPPQVKFVDSTNQGTNIPPQVKPMDSTTDEPDDLTDKTTDEPDDLTNY